MTTTCRHLVRPAECLPILEPMRTPPRWLRERRRTAHAAGPASPAAEVASPPAPPADWTRPGEPLSEPEWAAFVAALEEARGHSMPLLHSSTPTSSPC